MPAALRPGGSAVVVVVLVADNFGCPPRALFVGGKVENSRVRWKRGTVARARATLWCHAAALLLLGSVRFGALGRSRPHRAGRPIPFAVAWLSGCKARRVADLEARARGSMSSPHGSLDV